MNVIVATVNVSIAKTCPCMMMYPSARPESMDLGRRTRRSAFYFMVLFFLETFNGQIFHLAKTEQLAN